MTETLNSWLETEPRYLGETWLTGLEDRKQEEANYHDFERSGKKAEEEGHVAGNAHWYDAAAPVAEYIKRWIRKRRPGRSFLSMLAVRGQCLSRSRTRARSWWSG